MIGLTTLLADDAMLEGRAQAPSALCSERRRRGLTVRVGRRQMVVDEELPVLLEDRSLSNGFVTPGRKKAREEANSPGPLEERLCLRLQKVIPDGELGSC